ncbi:MAG: hypothetical protein ACLGHN_08550 [Bacteriovoracia bacterium]
MKNLFIVLALLFSLGSAFAQSGIEATSATTLSPFATATRLMESATVTSLAPFASTIATAQARGVAGREQLKDELVALNDDMVAGVVRSIDDVRQPTLKELFLEIEADEAQMENINAVVAEGSKLHRIATAVTVALLAE